MKDKQDLIGNILFSLSTYKGNDFIDVVGNSRKTSCSKISLSAEGTIRLKYVVTNTFAV